MGVVAKGLSRAFKARSTGIRTGVVVVYQHLGLLENREEPCPFEIRPLSPGNVEDIAGIESSTVVDRFRTFLRAGDLGYYVYVDGVVAHRGWLQLGPGNARCELGVSFRLGERDAYVHSSKTYPPFRGRGIYTAVLKHIAWDKQTQGLRLFIATVEGNKASMRCIEKAGFGLICRVFSLAWRGRSLLRLPLWKGRHRTVS